MEYSVAGEDGPWETVPTDSVTVSCADESEEDLAVVIDNSGSEDGFIEALQTGARAMVDGVLAEGGRASLVRVSTDAEVLVPLTAEVDALDTAVDGLYVGDGWTALWDGVRMGNETLGPDVDPVDNLATFCGQSGRLGVVAFTDGMDNNSAGEQDYDHTSFPGDGIDTTVADLDGLRSGGATTPIYTIGLGADVDHDTLEALATASGGRHRAISDASEVAGAFDLVSSYFQSNEQVCAEIPETECGPMTVRLTWTWSDGEGEPVTGTVTETVDVDCEADPTGRTAVMLLTLSNPGISATTAGTLADNAVGWASELDDLSILVVLDENHHSEFATDADYVAGLLLDAGYRVARLDESDGGITDDDLAGYDLVWYCNPGYPPDDEGSIAALEAFSAAGGGLVLQGDDMAWSWGNAFSMSGLTHRSFSSNGTDFCGAWTDNNAGSSYRVTFSDASHEVIDGLENTTFLYGDDIDTTTALEGDEVLATATLDGGSGCDTVPVVVAYDP